MFAVVYCAQSMGPAIFDPEVGINFALMVHGGQEFVWGPLVVAGDEITTTVARQVDRGARRQRLLRLRVPVGQPGRRDRLHRHLDQHRARRLMNAGDAIPELKTTPDRYLTFATPGRRATSTRSTSTRTSPSRSGLPGRILHGLWTMAQVARAQTEAARRPALARAARGAVPRHGRARGRARGHRRGARGARRRGGHRHARRAERQGDHPQRRGGGPVCLRSKGCSPPARN